MAFEVADGVGVEAGTAIGASQRKLLPLDFRPRDAAAAVRGDAPAANQRVDAAALATASEARISTTSPQPSPGQKPALRAS